MLKRRFFSIGNSAFSIQHSMPIIIKSRREIEMMRRAGYLGAQILQKMHAAVAPGVTTGEINAIARNELQKAGAIGMAKNYPTYKPNEGYPAETCISVNEEIVHGIPGPRKPFKLVRFALSNEALNTNSPTASRIAFAM